MKLFEYLYLVLLILPTFTIQKNFIDSDFTFDDGKATREGRIEAVVNKFVDKLFVNIQKLMVHKGFDPYKLENQSIQLPLKAAFLNLTSGWLQNLSTIRRHGTVSLSYSSSLKKLSTNVSITFQEELLLTYRYFAKALFVSLKGDVAGKVSNPIASVSLSFDFEKYQVFLDSLDITDTGTLSLTFTGHDNVDWLVNLMSKTVSRLFHSLILRTVQFIIRIGLVTYIDEINEAIHNAVHRNNDTNSAASFFTIV